MFVIAWQGLARTEHTCRDGRRMYAGIHLRIMCVHVATSRIRAGVEREMVLLRHDPGVIPTLELFIP